MNLPIVAVILGAIALGSVLLVAWMAGAALFGLIRFVFGFGRGGVFGTLVRASVLVLLLLWVGHAISAGQRDNGNLRTQQMLDEALWVPAPENHPLQASCSSFEQRATHDRDILKGYRRNLSQRLATEDDPSARAALVNEVEAVDDWLAWLDAVGETARAVARTVDAGTALAAADRSGRPEYMDAASRLELDSEKARRRAALVLERFAARWTDGRTGHDVAQKAETSTAFVGPWSGGEVESP
jgi:hypothetical protein